jgi:hypothetical protein
LVAAFADGVELSKSTIGAVVQKNAADGRFCYEQALKKSPGTKGKVVMTWEVGPDGKVTSAGVKSNQGLDASVGECLAQKIKLWKFPESETGTPTVVAGFPFNFRPL